MLITICTAALDTAWLLGMASRANAIALLARLVDGAAEVIPQPQSLATPQTPLGPFLEAAVARGIVPALTRACVRFCEETEYAPRRAFTDSFGMLVRILYHTVGTRFLPDACQNGFLDALVRHGSLWHSEADATIAIILFNGILAGALVYRDSLLALRDAIADAAPLADGKSFSESLLYSHWLVLVLNTHERCVVVNKAGAASKGCDNPACEKIAARTEFRRCSSCQAAYYCSKTCQAADWDSRHRDDACCTPPTFVLGNHMKADFSFHTRDYLRAVVQHYYELNLDDIHNALAAEGLCQSGRARWAGSPQVPVPVLMLDLTAPLAALAVMSSDDPRIPSLFPESYADWVLFVRGLAGRGSALHLVRVRYRGAIRTLVVPLRIPNAIREQQLRQVRELARDEAARGDGHNGGGSIYAGATADQGRDSA
ncbi:MYND-type domain-containing protein [Mycena kentingensis (nom. inval.)]|nr:MYND-type domain-containing protein [Mycena kentingensis (nom. inval.)]